MRTAQLAIVVAFLAWLPLLPARAATEWTDWSTFSASSTAGSASGSLGGVTVSYSGEVILNSVVNGTFDGWQPASSFTGGGVTTSPNGVGDIITLAGQNPGSDTISFSAPVTDPLLAIWSLGSKDTNTSASFSFDSTPTLVACGPTLVPESECITVAGNVVSGLEGNGVILFSGSFTSISWTNTFEDFYGFTVGVVPEPSTAALFGLGLGALAMRRRRPSQVRCSD